MLPASFRAEVIEAVIAGKPAMVAAREAGMSCFWLRKWLRQAGVMLKPGKPSRHASSSVILPPAAKSFGAASGHGRRLQLADRILIELGIAQGRSPDEIASGLRVHRPTVFREIARHSLIAEDGRWGNHDAHYSAALAQFWADQARARPKAFKLETLPLLRRMVVAMLDQKLSPQQVSVRLRRLFPDDKNMQISHETLYQGLSIRLCKRGVHR